MNKFSQASAIVIDGEEWVSAREAARRLLPSVLLLDPREQAKKLRSRANILLRLASAGKITKRQHPHQKQPLYLSWSDVQDYYRRHLPIVPKVVGV